MFITTSTPKNAKKAKLRDMKKFYIFKSNIRIQAAANKLNIHAGNISSICCKRKSYKTAKSKKDGCKYTFKFID